MNVLVVQGEVPRYRVPLFQGLESDSERNLTVAHCGASGNGDSTFKEVILEQKSFCGLKWLFGLSPLVNRADVIVLMFDLRWPTIILQAILRPKKCVLWGHGLGRSKLARRIRIWLARRVMAVLVYEEEGKGSLVAEGIDPGKIFVAGNTIEVSHPGRRPGVRKRFVYVGRLQVRKRLEELLDAFAAVVSSMKREVGITIIGDGPIKDDLRARAKRLGIDDKVSFMGSLYNGDALAHEYSQAIAYVSPGHVGLGVLHSFAYGVPVVTKISDRHAPEVENIVHGVTGILYGGDSEELGAILRSLVNDEDLAQTLGENALSRYLAERTMPLMISRFRQAIDFVHANS